MGQKYKEPISGSAENDDKFRLAKKDRNPSEIFSCVVRKKNKCAYKHDLHILDSHAIKSNRDLQQTVNGKVNEIPLGLPPVRLDFLQY